MSNAAAMRPTGVVIPTSQLQTKAAGTPRTITGFAEAKTYGVEYVDDEGTKHVTIAMCIGGRWYLAPNGENYASTLKPVSHEGWLGKALEERRLTENTSTLPKQDAVDVLGR